MQKRTAEGTTTVPVPLYEELAEERKMNRRLGLFSHGFRYIVIAMRAIAAVGGTVLALSILLACRTQIDTTASERVSEEERALAADAVEVLRKVLNEGTCESVLHAAIERAQSQQWIERCNHVRDAWGNWKGFRPSYWYRSGETAIAIEGTAEFAKGNGIVQVVWDLQRKPANMRAFFLSSGRDRVEFPPLPSRYFNPHFDPPAKRGWAVG